MKKIIIKLAVVSSCIGTTLPTYFQNDSPINETFLKRDVIALATDCETILEEDKPVVSPDGGKIAWTTRKKSPAGSKIFLKEECNKEIEISPPESNSWGPSWSADGKQIAYYSDASGKLGLWIYDLDKQSNKNLWVNPKEYLSDGFAKVAWNSIRHEIYVLGRASIQEKNPFLDKSFSHFRTKEKEQPHDISGADNRLFSINTDTGVEQSLLEENEASYIYSFSVSPSGDWISYINYKLNQDPSLKLHGIIGDIEVISSDGKTKFSIAKSVGKGFDYEIQLFWDLYSDSLYFLDEQKIWKAELSKEGLVSCKPIQEVSTSFDPSTLAFTKDGKHLIAGLDSVKMYDYSINRPTKLSLISLDQSQVQSYPLPEQWRFKSLILNKNGVVLQPSTECIAFIAQKTDDASVKSLLLLNLSTGAVRSVWEGRSSLLPIDFSSDHQRLYLFYENFTTYNEICTYDFQHNIFEVLSHAGKELSNLDVGGFHLITSQVMGNDGKLETVSTGIILPPGAKPEDRLPAIVVQYPGANCSLRICRFGGGDLIGSVPQWMLTNHGFVIILPDLVMGEKGIGNPLQVMTERLIPQVNRAIEWGYIDKNRVGIIGQSYGGYGTVGIISHTDIFAAAVAISGIYDLASFSYHLDDQGNNFWLTWAEVDQGNMGLSLFDDPQRYIHNSPFYRADKIYTPLLLIHGQLDDAFEDAGKMFSALRRLNRNAELVIYRNGGHVIGDMKKEDQIHAKEQILNYFHDHL